MQIIINVFQRINKTKIQCNQIRPDTTQKQDCKKMERCIRNNSGIIVECFRALIPIAFHEMQLPALNLMVCHSSIKN